jgi:hypothetical protein
MNPTPPIGLLISVPWPVRLLGDFQDVTGMPAFTAAIDLRTVVGATPRTDALCQVTGAGLPAPVPFTLNGDPAPLAAIPSLARALAGLRARNVTLRGGYDFQVLTRAPWPVADSPALDVAWTALLLELHGLLRSLSGNEIADYAMAGRAALELHARLFPELCAAALGGALFVDSGDSRSAKSCERALPDMVLALPKGPAPADSPAVVVRAMLQSLLEMRRKWDAFDVRTSELDRVVPMLNLLTPADAGRVYSQILARDLCRQARELMEEVSGLDDDRLAELIDGAHELLRDYHALSSPELEALVTAATGGGAIACRMLPGLNAVLALAPGRQKDVLDALRAAGADARGVALSDGIRLEQVASPKSDSPHRTHGPDTAHPP